MLTIKNYVKAESLQEAYELNQSRSSRIKGGMMWMRLSNARIQTLIDLSGLGLDQIEETGKTFKIGCMCTLRDLEMHEGLNEYSHGAIRECVRHIVGVQFRNQATVGGSIYGRFGFSDVLTCLLALDTFVELYEGGTIRLAEFLKQKPGHDILVSIIIRKKKRQVRYSAFRQCATDLPVLTCAVVRGDGNWYVAVGARPMKAEHLEKSWEIADAGCKEQIEVCAKEAAAEFTYGSNMRGSAKYRQHLAEVLIGRAMTSILMEDENEA